MASPTAKQRKTTVCIIGAGAAGLCAARRCAADPTLTVTVLERGGRCGGTWVHEPDPARAEVHSSMYDTMTTNLPKETMSFRDFPFHGTTEESFVSRQEVLDYLTQYSQPVRHLIKFRHLVLNVEPHYDDVGRHAKETEARWRVDYEVRESGARHSAIFDCVFVCNGHLCVPRLPAFAPIYRKSAIHSHFYRRPEPYTGKRVAVVGHGPSGCDIAAQLVEHAKSVHLLYRDVVPQTPKFGRLTDSRVQISAVTGAEGNALILCGGERLVVDEVIYCTSYRFSFPFFRTDAGLDEYRAQMYGVTENTDNNKSNAANATAKKTTIVVDLIEDARGVRPLFAHLSHRDHPHSLFFIGVPVVTSPFLCFEQQSHFALALLRRQIPNSAVSAEHMRDFEENKLRELSERGLPLAAFHRLADKQWDYYDWLRHCVEVGQRESLAASGAEQPPPYWERHPRIPPVVRKIYELVEKERKRDVQKYHEVRYQILDDENVNIVYPPNY